MWDPRTCFVVFSGPAEDPRVRNWDQRGTRGTRAGPAQALCDVFRIEKKNARVLGPAWDPRRTRAGLLEDARVRNWVLTFSGSVEDARVRKWDPLGTRSNLYETRACVLCSFRGPQRTCVLQSGPEVGLAHAAPHGTRASSYTPLGFVAEDQQSKNRTPCGAHSQVVPAWDPRRRAIHMRSAPCGTTRPPANGRMVRNQ